MGILNLFGKRERDTGAKKDGQSLAKRFDESAEGWKFLAPSGDTFETQTSAEKAKLVFQKALSDIKLVVRSATGETRLMTAMDAMPDLTNSFGASYVQATHGASNGATGATGSSGSPLVYDDPIRDDVWSHYLGEIFIGWSACAMLAQNDIVHLACNIPAEDAVACGFKLSFADNDEADADKDGNKDADYLTKLIKATEAMGITRACVKMEYNKRVFGTGIAFPLIYRGGKLLDMSKPFNIDGIKKGDDYRGWKIVDPYWLMPEFEEGALANPLHERYMKPSWYRLTNGTRVHHSWFIQCDNVEPADILKATYHFGGIPLSQQIYKRVWCAEKTANEAPLLAMSKRLLIIDADVEQIVKNNSWARKLMETVTRCRTNWGVFFKRPGTELQQIDTSLTDFEECMMSQYQLVASIAQMPATKLLQTTPKGFNSTGEFEWKIYAQLLQSIQNNDYRPLIERHIKILTKIDGHSRVVTVTFNPVDAPNERDKADIEATKANTRATYVQNQILTPEEVRNSLRNDPDGEFSGIQIENKELKEDNAQMVEEALRKIEREDSEEDEA